MIIENLEKLNGVLLEEDVSKADKVVLCIKDNKSDATIDLLNVNHPVTFLRQFQEYLNQLKMPVSDVDILLIGRISEHLNLYDFSEIYTLSPYCYFKRSDENVDSDSTVSS